MGMRFARLLFLMGLLTVASAILPVIASATPCGYTTKYDGREIPEVLPGGIPGGSPTGLKSSIYLTRSNTPNRALEDLEVELNIAHGEPRDLDIYLQHAGVTIQLSTDNPGGSGIVPGNYTGTIFDDEAASSITTGSPPFSGSFNPEQALTAFDGKDSSGLWTLIVSDDTGQLSGGGGGGPNLGTLVSWGVDIEAASCGQDTACYEVGNRMTDPLYPGSNGSTTSISTVGEGTFADADVRIIGTSTGDATPVNLKFKTFTNSTQQVILANGVGQGEFTNTIFDDAAATSITAGASPFTGRFRPEEAISGPGSPFQGLTIQRLWQLELAYPIHVTQFAGWGIRIIPVGGCVDTDADQIYNTADNCDDVINAGQENYEGDAQGDICDLDDDNDTVPDATDRCPQGGRYGLPPPDIDGDGCRANEDLDDDGDGLSDTADRCPAGAIGPGGDVDGDGCKAAEDTDDDGDGALDTTDSCPNDKDNANTDGDALANGCDPDDDGDFIIDEGDNCRLIKNRDQRDTDRDKKGDACETDDDADTLLDTKDLCPVLKGPKPAGCPRFSRKLRLSYSSRTKTFRGTISSAKQPQCSNKRFVQIYLSKAGPDKRIGKRLRTSSQGGFKLKRGVGAGRYYARSTAVTLKGVASCRQGTSKSLRIRP